jgi:hypothetical protein
MAGTREGAIRRWKKVRKIDRRRLTAAATLASAENNKVRRLTKAVAEARAVGVQLHLDPATQAAIDRAEARKLAQAIDLVKAAGYQLQEVS